MCYMIEGFGKFFVTIFGSNSWLATMIISMFPIIELKGAIPVGVSREFWGENALSEPQAFLFSLIGSCLVVPLIALIFKPVITYMKQTKIFKKLALVIEDKVNSSTNRLAIKSADGGKSRWKTTILKMLGVFAFVAVPLPLTGVWTGTCIAVCLGLRFWQTVVSVVLGNIVAGFLVTTVCTLFPNFTSILFLIVLALVIVLLLIMLIKVLTTKKTKEE